MDFNPAFHESLPEFGEPPQKVCAVCQAAAVKSCGACQGAHYCSVEHQKSHWKEHMKDCPPIKIATSPDLGPHFVAARDLPPWTLLLTEHPVLVDPVVIYKNRPPSCISCRSILSTPKKCHRCSIPYFCDLACSMNKIHSEFECGVLSKCSVEQRMILCKPPNLMYLRAIHLKNNDPESWSKLLELPGANQYKPEDVSVRDKWFIREFLPLLGEQGGGFDQDLAKLMGITMQRGSMVCANENSGESQFYYLKGSHFAQNCFPNCIKIIGKGPQFQMEIRNTVEVKMGQIISIDYQVVSSEVRAMSRQHIIHDVRGALCICPRCRDRTEMGTMQSAVKCEECFDGYLFPENVRDMTMSAPWICNRLGCKGKEFTWEEIEKLTSKLALEVKSFKYGTSDFKDIGKFWESLKNSLHPNHIIVVNFEREATRALNSHILAESELRNKIPLPRMVLHIRMLEHLLKVAELIDPGLSLSRSYILSYLFIALYHKALWYGEILQEAEEKQLMKKAIEVIDKFLPIAKCYPDHWTNTTKIQYLMDKRRELQETLNFGN